MWGFGWGAGGVFVVIFIVFMAWMMMGRGMMGHGGRRHSDTASGAVKESNSSAREILAERFARGEISEDEFEQRKRVLERELS